MANREHLTAEDEAALTALWLHDDRERSLGRGAHFVTIEAERFRRIYQELARICYLVDPHDEEEIKRAYKDALNYKKGL